MDLDNLPAALQRPLVVQALEELKVLTHDEIERERYESRRKAQLDYNTMMAEASLARQEGRLEGWLEGEKIGIIHTLERLLNRSETATEQLAALSLDALNQLAN